MAAIREDTVRSEIQREKYATGVKERLFWEGIKGRGIGAQGKTIIQTLSQGNSRSGEFYTFYFTLSLNCMI